MPPGPFKRSVKTLPKHSDKKKTAEDQEIEWVTVTLPSEPFDAHCQHCGEEFRNIQAPHKPAGVIMMRLCGCKYELDTTNTCS